VLRAAWITVLQTACMAEVIGVAFAIWPEAWMRAFSADAAVVAVGVAYLRTVGPFFDVFGVGYAPYCAGQVTLGRKEGSNPSSFAKGYRNDNSRHVGHGP
jgi:hypothetical protein